MKITKTIPAFKDYIWGGSKLKTEFNKKTDLAVVAESWELAAHKDGTSGFEGESFDLADLFENHRELIGTNPDKFERFPMIIKLIDAKNNLSVQVHPSDEYALKNENSYGKTEMWYVVEAEPGAGLYVGFNRDVTEEEFRTLIAENRLQEVLHFIPVKPGEWFFIEAGTVHAIGKGVLIAERHQKTQSTGMNFPARRTLLGLAASQAVLPPTMTICNPVGAGQLPSNPALESYCAGSNITRSAK